MNNPKADQQVEATQHLVEIRSELGLDSIVRAAADREFNREEHARVELWFDRIFGGAVR